MELFIETGNKETIAFEIPSGRDYYGIRYPAERWVFKKDLVDAALKQDGWNSLEELDASPNMVGWLWLKHRVRHCSRVILG